MSEKRTKVKRVEYWDKQIRGVKDQRTYYLRHKWVKRGGELFISIRTQANGKGRSIATVKGEVMDDQSKLKLHHKLCKKFKFQYVIFQDLPTIETESK